MVERIVHRLRPAAIIILCFWGWCFVEMSHNLAGQETNVVVDFVISALADISVPEWLGYALAGVGGGFTVIQRRTCRKLEKENLEREKIINTLESQRDELAARLGDDK